MSSGPATRYVSGGMVAGQSMAAGEAMIVLPTVQTVVVGLQGVGAPAEMNVPQITVGLENRIIMTASGVAPHPNAARVFVNWLLSEEPNKEVNKLGGTISIYDDSIPEFYISPGAVENVLTREEVSELIGPR